MTQHTESGVKDEESADDMWTNLDSFVYAMC